MSTWFLKGFSNLLLPSNSKAPIVLLCSKNMVFYKLQLPNSSCFWLHWFANCPIKSQFIKALLIRHFLMPFDKANERSHKLKERHQIMKANSSFTSFFKQNLMIRSEFRFSPNFWSCLLSVLPYWFWISYSKLELWLNISVNFWVVLGAGTYPSWC